ncbi:MAG: preprotein translocase subunit SecE [Chloroflexi bacterium]|nr:preprotein translocase subunit SecE [Chloroflexota bacterium]
MAENIVKSNPISTYLREVRAELRKVTWPTREESWRLTIIVLIVTILFALFLWGFDTIFSTGVQELVRQFLGI